MSAAAESAELARRVLAALGRGDAHAFGRLAAEEIEIHTARGVRRGHAEALAWAANKYDHLWRRYEVDRIEPLESGEREPGEAELAGVLVRGRTEYVWKESERIADSSPVAIELRFRDGLLAQWRFREDLAG